MKEEERKIWEAHLKRLAVINKKWEAFGNLYYQKMDVLKLEFGGTENIPLEKRLPLGKQFGERKQEMIQAKDEEEKRYMKEIEKYDLKKTSSFLKGKDKDMDKE